MANCDLRKMSLVGVREGEWIVRKTLGDIVAHQKTGNHVRGFVGVPVEVAGERAARPLNAGGDGQNNQEDRDMQLLQTSF